MPGSDEVLDLIGKCDGEPIQIDDDDIGLIRSVCQLDEVDFLSTQAVAVTEDFSEEGFSNLTIAS